MPIRQYRGPESSNSDFHALRAGSEIREGKGKSLFEKPAGETYLKIG